ncbi:chromosome segregation protein SMC [Arachnia propionica]|uniref:Chromosome partition protein Smc n=1 Tax=Arachnia propionica TaxID=1750 RepID=A0A3P1WTG7_9ACTN|nr:chromosome segregation protein SMC [Arachnia propionica]RRD48660.1 chromosome segregation protein SMC [Arachnia propionica]
MYLKQLTLRGFKSFASATTLNFEPGITCIVGPNGSGKSNVVDALSWVMGEQGAKSLRGGKMEDVIFAGTAKRAPLGRAEVQLTIDNSDGALPIDYAEVTITRTMFRSGGSEYSINGSPARLLDVTELLSDSGIGREMHVIVGQGQLDAILQATPESRRGFIEEAAGVLKHRKRKEKAERKLEGTRANLERLEDLIGELQRQLKPLGRQAEAARRAAVIQAELRDAKARLLADDLHQAMRMMAEAEADEKEAEQARIRAEAEVAAAAEAEQGCERDLTQASRSFDTSQEHWYAAAALRERIASTLTVAAERMRFADAQPMLDVSSRDPEQLEAEAAGIREREAELGEAIREARTRLEEATAERGAAEQAQMDEERAYATALRALSDRREGMARLAGQLASISSRMDAGREERERLAERREEVLSRAREAGNRYQETELRLSGLGRDESELDAAHDEASTAHDAEAAEVSRLAEEEVRLGRERAAVTARVEALRLASSQRDGSADLLERPDVLGRLGDLISVTPGWEQAVAAGLGAAAEAVVAAGLDDAVAAVRHLDEQDLGRAAVLAAGAEPGRESPVMELLVAPEEVRGLLSRLLAGVVVVEDLGEARRVVDADPDAIAVTRQGDRMAAWLVEGGSAARPSLLALNAELARAEEELDGLGADWDRNRFALEQARGRLTELEAAVEASLNALHASDAELAAVADALAGFRQTQAAATKEAERLGRALAEAEHAAAGLEEQRAELETRVAAASAEELEEPDPTARDEQAVRARLARQAEMEARLALRSLEEQARALAGRADGLLRAAAAERQSRAKAAAKAEELRREAAVAEAVHAAAARLLDEAEQVLQRAADQRAEAEERRTEAEAATTTARERSRQAGMRLEELVRGAHRDELVRIEHRMRHEQLVEKAMAELGLEPDVLLTEYGPDLPVPVLTRPDGSALQEGDEIPEPVDYDRGEQEKRLRRAERALTALGKVNPLALEEFEALKTRHAFLAEQLQDLRQTRADLLALIDDVDRRVQEVFRAAWLDVEATFEKVFSRLFPGGEGRLILTEPGNWLETGVDVEARPAGKQVKRLSLLSGGERSLVAVAFLVSLFIARPSPFYILDEVEAALDDANLGRLLGIYEELRENSQLLVITHQKRTMEIADTLYGVTMRGDGISTVVSQRL